MTRSLIILGTGGSAYDVLDIVAALNAESPTWKLAGFLDDARPPGSRYLDLPILGGLREATRFTDCSLINVIGSETSYRRRAEIVQSTNLDPTGLRRSCIRRLRFHLGRVWGAGCTSPLEPASVAASSPAIMCRSAQLVLLGTIR